MHVRVWLHKTEAFVSGGTQDKFFLVPTKTGMAITVPAVVAATALDFTLAYKARGGKLYTSL